MKTEQQDKLWKELSEENRKTLQYEYQDYIDDIDDSEVCDIERANLEGRVKVMKALFGTHNLNPKPPTPKTYDDIAKDKPFELADVNPKIHNKVIATAMIAELIEKGYGGMISKEEWENDNKEKFKITPFKNGGFQVVRYYSIQHKDILSFRDRKIAEEFMSHESNRKLVEMYYLM